MQYRNIALNLNYKKTEKDNFLLEMEMENNLILLNISLLWHLLHQQLTL